MNAEVADACLAQVQSLWTRTAENLRPFAVWIVERLPVTPPEFHEQTGVHRCWYLDDNGIASKHRLDYIRFLEMQSPHAPSSARSAMGVFGNRQGQIHAIGLAAFAPIAGSEDVYIEYIWGAKFALGSVYAFDAAGGKLNLLDNVWRP